MEIINACREDFKFSLPSQQISVRNAKFMESDGAKIDIMRWYCVGCSLQLMSCSIALTVLLLLLLL